MVFRKIILKQILQTILWNKVDRETSYPIFQHGWQRMLYDLQRNICQYSIHSEHNAAVKYAIRQMIHIRKMSGRWAKNLVSRKVLYFHQVATTEYCNYIGWKRSRPWLWLAEANCTLAAVFLVHFNVYLISYHLVTIFMESVIYDLLCLKRKMSNKRRGKTYI